MSVFNRYPALLLCGFLAATLGCQSAQKSSTFMPPMQAQAPALASGTPHSNPQKPTPPAADESPTSAQAQQALSVDPVADLIARVEKEYKTGEDNYRDGHLEAAKPNFDSAFNQLLGSGLDLQSDDRLEAELNRILDGINELEIAALQQGDGFSAQPSEPAPIDEANEPTPTVDQNVKANAEAEIKSTHSDLPLMMTDQVAGYINYFSNRGRGTLERALARSGRYDEMIRRTLKQEGVPQDLIYLAQAESGFHPLAVSRAGARGIWQFMASRAKGYGLERDWWMDERQDPEKATRAAAHHLHDLYNQFGDWYLAMAAYNSGPGTVQSAVKRTGYADFWELYRRNVLPKETRNYVPIILAVTIMAKNPEQYGLSSVIKEQPIPYDTVKINYPVDLRLVAECVDASASDLQDLNPSLLRLTTPKDHTFELHVPVGTAAKFETAVASIPVDKRVWWRYHKVQAGETLASIARTYHTLPRSIAEANDLDGNELAPESRLIIPIAPGKQADSTTYSRAITHYKIRRGDTVESVAANFGISAKAIRTWNRLKGNSLAGRKTLLVRLPVSPSARETQVASSTRNTSRGKKLRHGKTTAQESTASETPTVSDKRPARPAASSTHAAASTARVSTGHVQTQTAAAATVHHRVKAGETLYSIATSYNTTVSALKHDNRNIAVLRPGMILIVRDVR